jgi:hypothetical protein
MRRLQPWIVLAAALSLPTLAGAGVAVYYAKSVDFSRFQTFAWIPGTPAANPEIEERIHRAVEAKLAAKGIAKVDGEADLLVATHASVESERREDVDILGVPQRWGEGAEATGTAGEYLREIDVGTLMVDMLDGNSRLQVWRATASRVLTSDPKRSEKRIQKATRKMFENFPPQR